MTRDDEIIYRDDLLYEYALLTAVAFGRVRRRPQDDLDFNLDNVWAHRKLQEVVRRFREDHPQANEGVPWGIGFDRPGRPANARQPRYPLD